MGDNYIKQRKKRDKVCFDAGERVGMQKMWDFLQQSLRDPDTVGRDIFGKARFAKIYKKCSALADHYAKAFSSDVEADVLQEELDRAGQTSIDSDWAGYLEAYRKFLTEHDVEWELIEHPDWHEEHLYAGTLDRYGKVDGIQTLVDLKTASTVQKALYGASMNLYRMMLERRGKAVERLLILHLKKDGTYKLVHIDKDDAVPMALIKLHQVTAKQRKRRK